MKRVLGVRFITNVILATVVGLTMAGCNMKKNTATNRMYHSLTARYNIYYNGQLAFIDGNLEKEKGNKEAKRNFKRRYILYFIFHCV